MDKKNISIMLLVFYTLVVNSQESKLRVGIGVKPIISSITKSNPNLEFDSFYAISPSITVDYKVTKNILLSSGIEYEKKGGRNEYYIFDSIGFAVGETASMFHFNFLQVPIIATYRSSGKVKFYANLGLTFAYLFDQYLTQEDNIYPDSKTNFNEFELSLLLGAGIELKCNDYFDLGVGLRNNQGLTNLVSDNGVLHLKTNTLGIMVNLSYNL